MQKLAPVLLLLAFVPGCGPLATPAVRRLDAEEQARVDDSWDNMLAPPRRLDREVLLDTIVAFQLHQSGVDRLHMHSEKDFPGGVVLMDVTFDRTRPDNDAFWVTVHDGRGRMLRCERYAAQDILQRRDELFGNQIRGGAANVPAEADAAARQAALERRWARITAATQPAQ